MLLLTNFGAEQMLLVCTDRQHPLELWVSVRWLLAAPPMDKTKTRVDDYTTSTNVEVPFVDLTPDGWTAPVLVNGRMMIQYGPPPIICAPTIDCVVYGTLMCDPNDNVHWVDRWDTPREFEADETAQVLIAFALASECPPLGGCS